MKKYVKYTLKKLALYMNKTRSRFRVYIKPHREEE